MKLPELIQNVKTTFYNNRIPNTNLLDDRQIIFWINEVRALWLKREYDKVRVPFQNERQVLSVIEMEPYDKTIINNKSLLRSKKIIPRCIHWNTSDGVLKVSGVDILANNINYTDRDSIIYKGNGIFNSKKIFAFKNDDYLWLIFGPNSNKSRIPNKLTIEGIFENPLEVDEFNDNEYILNGEKDYPVSNSFLIFIETEIYKTHQQRFIKDIQNDDEEEIRQNIHQK